MKKKSVLSLLLIVFLVFLFCACSNGDGRKSEFTYGNISDGMEYTLIGETQQQFMSIYSKSGFNKSAFSTVSETDDGGIVAYGEGIYVYSPDKNDKQEVLNEWYRECCKNQE